MEKPPPTALLMPTSDEIQWFAIQARPGAEAVAESNLRALPIETLLPLARRPVHHATRSTSDGSAAAISGLSLCAILRGRFAASGELQPRRVTCGRRGRTALADGRCHHCRHSRTHRPSKGTLKCASPHSRMGDRVCITAGPLAGWSGVFDSALSDAERVIILIETLQQGRVVIRRDCLELSEAA